MVYGSNSALGTTQLVDSLNISKDRYMNRNDHHSCTNKWKTTDTSYVFAMDLSRMVFVFCTLFLT